MALPEPSMDAHWTLLEGYWLVLGVLGGGLKNIIISKIANSAETRLFRTRRGEIDPGESENGLKTPRHEII